MRNFFVKLELATELLVIALLTKMTKEHRIGLQDDVQTEHIRRPRCFRHGDERDPNYKAVGVLDIQPSVYFAGGRGEAEASCSADGDTLRLKIRYKWDQEAELEATWTRVEGKDLFEASSVTARVQFGTNYPRGLRFRRATAMAPDSPLHGVEWPSLPQSELFDMADPATDAKAA